VEPASDIRFVFAGSEDHQKGVRLHGHVGNAPLGQVVRLIGEEPAVKAGGGSADVQQFDPVRIVAVFVTKGAPLFAARNSLMTTGGAARWGPACNVQAPPAKSFDGTDKSRMPWSGAKATCTTPGAGWGNEKHKLARHSRSGRSLAPH